MNKLFAFVAGATVGSLVTWSLVKTKYEQIANEEIKSVKETYKKKYDPEEDLIKEVECENASKEIEHQEQLEKYNKIVNEAGYRNYSVKKEKPKKEEKNKEDDEKMNDKPYVISPEDFADDEDYDVVTLTYYEDGVLTNEKGDVITDIEGTIGINPEEHFGEYEKDSVFVRDDVNEVNYEILADGSNYSDLYH